MSQIGREIGISPPTAKRCLNLLNYTYQWLKIPAYHGSTIKRLSGKSDGCFTDTGFACYKQRVSSPEALAISPQLGALFETWVVNHLHKQAHQMLVPPNFYHWRTSAGAELDLILERDGCFYPIEIKCKTNPTKSDGKTLRGSRDWDKNHPLHLLHAWSVEDGICIGQVAVNHKSNEITAFPELLAQLDIQEAVITADAIHTQKASLKVVTEKKADYAFPVIENESSLLEDIKLMQPIRQH